MIKISACVITKNEAKNIQRWLDCASQVADEMIVVDTGSEDETVALAQAGGAQVYHFAWINDFAAAKNFALAQAKGKWIIFLDADEYFSPHTEAKVRGIIARYDPDYQVAGLICRLINIDVDNNNMFSGGSAQIRIFRNLSFLRYKGKVHEYLHNANQQKKMRIVTELEIYHTGYSSGVVQKKLRRNLEILQQEASEGEEKPELALYFMDCYYGLGEYEKAIDFAHKAIDSGKRFIGGETDAYATLISSLRLLERPLPEILSVIEEAESKYPEVAQFPLLHGFYLWEEHDYLEAGRKLEQALARKENDAAKLVNCLSDNISYFLPRAYMYMGQLVLMKQGSRAAALEYFIEGLRVYVYESELLICALQCLRQEDSAVVVQFLEGFYDLKQDAPFLLDIVRRYCEGKVYLYCVKHAGLKLTEAEAYLAAGRYDAASLALGQQMARMYTLGIWSQAEGNKDGVLAVVMPKACKAVWQRPVQGVHAKNVITADMAERLGRLQASLQLMRAERKEKIQPAEAAEIVSEAVGQFVPDKEAALAYLTKHYNEHRQNLILAYGMAFLLSLAGYKERARKVLLSLTQSSDEIEALWAELSVEPDLPQVSIILSAEDRFDWWEASLHSILAQEYSNIEVLASCPKEWQDFVQQSAKGLLRLRLYTKKTAGELYALAQGRLRQVVQPGDVLRADCVAVMAAHLQQKEESGWILPSWGLISGSGCILPGGVSQAAEREVAFLQQEDTKRGDAAESAVCTSAVLFRQRLLSDWSTEEMLVQQLDRQRGILCPACLCYQRQAADGALL